MQTLHSNNTSLNKKQRIDNLDLYRAVAILVVIYHHISQMLLPNYFNDGYLYDLGRFGVEMFFILSGFLISGLFYNAKDFKHQNMFLFWVKRFLRTYPPYIIMLMISFLTVKMIRKDTHFDFGYLFFMQNFYYLIPFFTISWSLCIEEHYYLLFSFIHHFIKKISFNKHTYLVGLILFAIIPTFLRSIMGDATSQNFGYFKTATIFRFDSLVCGCIISFIINFYKPKLKITKLHVLLISILSILSAYYSIKVGNGYIYSYRYLVVVLLLSFLLFLIYYAPSFRLSKHWGIKLIAAMAYSLYLTHPTIINLFYYLLNHLHKGSPILITLICVLCIFLLGYTYYLLVEKKSIELRDKIIHN